MKKQITKIFHDSCRVCDETLKNNLDSIAFMAKELIKVLKRKKKIVIFGNGGSAADSQHIAAELIGRFKRERRSLPAISLTTDTSILTALGNDYGFDIVFARQLEGLAVKGDAVIAISTSGHSRNVIEAVKQAKKMEMKVFAFTGCKGGRLAKLCDASLIVPSYDTARIQEAHIVTAHAIVDIIEEAFYRK